MVWSFTTHTGASWSTAFLGQYSFIAGISKAEELFCLKGNYNIPTAVLKLRQTVKMLNFSQSDNLEKNEMQECTAFCFDQFTCLFWSGCLTFLGSNREKTAQIRPNYILKLRNLEMFLSVLSCMASSDTNLYKDKHLIVDSYQLLRIQGWTVCLKLCWCLKLCCYHIMLMLFSEVVSKILTGVLVSCRKRWESKRLNHMKFL